MAKFRCVCGEQISTSGYIPNPHEWLLVSAVEFDAFEAGVDAESLYRQMRLAYRCPSSDHLWVFWDGFDAPPRLYAPSDLPPGW